MQKFGSITEDQVYNYTWHFREISVSSKIMGSDHTCIFSIQLEYPFFVQTRSLWNNIEHFSRPLDFKVIRGLSYHFCFLKPCHYFRQADLYVASSSKCLNLKWGFPVILVYPLFLSFRSRPNVRSLFSSTHGGFTAFSKILRGWNIHACLRLVTFSFSNQCFCPLRLWCIDQYQEGNAIFTIRSGTWLRVSIILPSIKQRSELSSQSSSDAEGTNQIWSLCNITKL